MAIYTIFPLLYVCTDIFHEQCIVTSGIERTRNDQHFCDQQIVGDLDVISP